jgi:hypothetical protein
MVGHVAEERSDGLLTGYINRKGEYIWTTMG